MVLVGPKTPSNIGAVARLCANFEAPKLVLVGPRCDPLSEEVYKVACGSGVLEHIRVCADLREALADTSVPQAPSASPAVPGVQGSPIPV